LNQQIQNANKLIQEIVELNKSIVNSKAQTNSEAQTLVDKRATKLEELSNLFGINVSYNEDGTANVFVNGTNIITSQVGSFLKLNESVNNATGEKTLEILKINPENQSTTIITPQSGEIATNLKFYNIVLDDKESSNSFSIAKQLDEFANALVQSINSKTITGYGINDKGPQPPGRTFFEPNIGYVSASLIKVSKDIEDKPEDIPLSSKPAEPGNNDIARAIGRILGRSKFFGWSKSIGILR
jgi:Flagellar hook-associated protein